MGSTAVISNWSRRRYRDVGDFGSVPHIEKDERELDLAVIDLSSTKSFSQEIDVAFPF